MATLRIRNNFDAGNPTIIYSKNSVNQPPVSSSVDDPNCNYSTDDYRFRIDGNRNAGNAILFAYKDFTHCIEISDTETHPASNPNPVKIRIIPYPPFIGGGPDLKIIADKTFTSQESISRGSRYIPKKVAYSFNDDTSCMLEVNLNSVIKTYKPADDISGTITENLGDNGFAEFQVTGHLLLNQLKFIIKLDGIFSVRFTVYIMPTYNEIEIFDDTYTPHPEPETINITIQPG